VNDLEKLWQAKEFCNYSATNSDTPALALFWQSLSNVFAQAHEDFRTGRVNLYRGALIDAAKHLNDDIQGNLYDWELTVEDPE
jgi:hypothetical protein